MRRFPWRLDPLILIIILATILAFLLPARGENFEFLSIATKILIGFLFFLYGGRLSVSEVLAGIQQWRLHALILVFTFIVFPLIGIALRPTSTFLGAELYTGVLYLCIVPGTVQSAVTFTSIARGNVPGAIVSSSLSNILGVFLTPLLTFLLIAGPDTTGITFSTQSLRDIAVQLLLPFILGLASHRLLGGFAQSKAMRIVDKISIGFVVYSAFSQSIEFNVWATISGRTLAELIVGSIALVIFMLWLSRTTAQRLGFNRADSITVEFCGTKKSLASGLPMALILFPADQATIIIVPLMIFHLVQLLVCAQLAQRYARGELAEASKET